MATGKKVPVTRAQVRAAKAIIERSKATGRYVSPEVVKIANTGTSHSAQK